MADTAHPQQLLSQRFPALPCLMDLIHKISLRPLQGGISLKQLRIAQYDAEKIIKIVRNPVCQSIGRLPFLGLAKALPG